MGILGLDTLSEDHGPYDYEINVPVSLQRCGIESKLVVPGTDPGTAHIRTVQAMQNALHKGLKWNQELVSGRVDTMKELAAKEGVTQRYLSHLVRMAWLSPEIMQAIIRGQVPATLSLDKLKKGFPLDWDEQWRKLGFASSTLDANMT